MHKVPENLIDQIYATIQELEDSALQPHYTEDEIFLECKLCGEMDSHTVECPIDMLYGFTTRNC